MSITQTTQAAHDTFVRAVQNCVSPFIKLASDLKAFIEEAARLDKITPQRRSVIIQELALKSGNLLDECTDATKSILSSLEKFHSEANKVDAFIQNDLKAIEDKVSAATAELEKLTLKIDEETL